MPFRFNHIAATSLKLDQLLDEVVQRTAFDIEAQAKQAAPVDTGHLRASIGSVRIGHASYEVAVNAHYGIYVELGTRYATAQPFLLPAARMAAAKVRAIGLTVGGGL